MKLSVVIPAYNEENSIEETVQDLHSTLTDEKIDHEILVVNDHSSDSTEAVLLELESKILNLRHINNPTPNGFGYAVRYGLNNFSGGVVVLGEEGDTGAHPFRGGRAESDVAVGYVGEVRVEGLLLCLK